MEGEGAAAAPPHAGGRLWHHRDFLKFWTGDTITQFTGQVTGLALPTIAVVTLDASGFQLGVLGALGVIAFPLLGLFVGVWMDRMKRRPVMIAADMIEAGMLATIPLAYYFGVLSIYQLFVVAAVTGTCTLFFDVAYQSYLPSLVAKEDVIEGNQKLQVSASSAQVVGPAVASGLMGLMGAAMSVAADVVGTVASALMLAWIGKPEQRPRSTGPDGGGHFFAEMKEGIRVITGNSLLWTQAGSTATANLGFSILFVALLLYAYRVMLITPGEIGIPFSIGAVGFLVGALASSRITARIGVGRTLAAAAASQILVLTALLGTGAFKLEVLGIALFVSYLGIPIYNINMVSLRQIITPNRLQGRMNATMRTIVWGTQPLGSFIGGILVTVLGIVPTFVAGAVVSALSFFWIALGPIGKLKKMPEPAGD
ncbi:MAG TPA: MFS transporter [Conexivisphaerales archaeon]|nr:MFS transporter [Conexivisphaerales archaeon]